VWIERVGEMIGFDMETTGVDVNEDRLVTAAIVTVHPDHDPIIREWLVNPGVAIPEEATAVHGITTEHAVANGMDAAEAVREIRDQLARPDNAPMVAFNAAFDFSMLAVECRRHHVDDLPNFWPIIDPLLIDKAVDTFRPGKRTLSAQCEFYGVRLDDAHQAKADVLGALRLVWAMARMARLARTDPQEVYLRYATRRDHSMIVRAWRELGDMTLPELHNAQVRWCEGQASSYRDYLMSRGENDKAATVSGEWPLRKLS
jgi:DNA polymerase III subunit epsilon